MSRASVWLRERLPVSGDQLRELTNEPVPNHLKRWWFCLGGTPAYLFVVQIVTGILLAMYYQPAPSTAYQSIQYISEQANYGWYFRSLHKWAATSSAVISPPRARADSMACAISGAIPSWGWSSGRTLGKAICVKLGRFLLSIPRMS